MALNAKTEDVTVNVKLRSDDDSERRTKKQGSGCRNENVALNAKIKMWLWTLNRRYDSECQGNDGALHAELKAWLWMLNRKERVALNAKLERDGDFERQTGRCGFEHQVGNRWWLWIPKLRMMVRMTLNADTEKWWLWPPKLRSGDDSERRNWEVMMMTLNPKIEKWWWWLWKPSWKCDDNGSERRNQKCDNDGSKRRNWKCDSERQIENVMMMALNAETKNATLNVKLKMWWWGLWTPKHKMRWWWLWTLKLKMRLWTSNWKRSSERQGEKAALYAK